MQQPDLILYNARVYTMDPRAPTASGLAVQGDRIVALEQENAWRGATSAAGQALDLGGRVVIPGLIDAHLHFIEYSLRLDRVSIYELPLDETLRRIGRQAGQAPPGTWIRGGGWNCSLWEGGAFPTRQILDRVVPDHPAALSSKDGHSLWINTRAMELAGLNAQTPDVPGGSIHRDAAGAPTGLLQEQAMDLVYRIIPRPTVQEMQAACERGLGYACRVGLTGVHNCEGAASLAVMQELKRLGRLTLRVLAHIPEEGLEEAIKLGLRDGFGDEWVRVRGVKAFSDGSLGSRSAWMLAPYEGTAANVGVPTTTPPAMRELVRRANGAGLSVAVHAIGDAANRVVLDAIAAVAEERPRHLRNRIEHVQLLHSNDLPRLAQLGVVASMQPVHATADIDLVERHWGSRGATSYAWRSLLDAGTVLAFGSDAPVEDISPLVGIHAAVTRRRADGTPGPEGWYPAQRLTVGEAIHAYTMGAAYAGGEEQIKGSLTPGKLADLVILDRDIFQIAPLEILQARVLGTMVGGSFVYQSEE